MGARAIGVDVGGTTIKVGVVDGEGRLSHQRQVPTPHETGNLVHVVGEQVADLQRTLTADDAGVSPVPVPVGVVVPGIVDEARGSVVYSANLGWRDVPMQELLSQALGTPPAFGHDIRAGALAESRWGQGSADMLFMALGTGIGASLVLDGRPRAGGGYAGELGQVLLPDPDGGAPVVLERLASASAIARRYAVAQARAAERGQGAGQSGHREPEVADDGARTVVHRARSGDHLAQQVLGQAVDALAEVLAAALVLAGPVRVVIGGGLAGAGEDLLTPLRTALAERLVITPLPEVVPAVLGPWAGCLGAGAMALERSNDGEQGA